MTDNRPGAAPAAAAAAPESEQGSMEAGSLSPARSAFRSEAQQMQRCTEVVEQCRRDLQDLRAACKAANSHREKCAELLGAATAAVIALEDMLYDPDIDVRRERALQQLASQVQAAMDQGEAVVKVYGSKNGFFKFASKLCSPGTPLKFDASILELSNLSKQARLTRQPPMASGGRLASSASTAMDAMRPPSYTAGQPAAAGGSQMTPTESGSIPESPRVPAGRGMDGSVGAPAAASAAMAGMASVAEQQLLPERQPLAEEGHHQHTMGMGDRAVPEEAMQVTRMHKGSRGQAISAMVFVPPLQPNPTGHLGYLWFYLSKSMFGGAMFVYDLSSKVESEVKDARQDPAVTCMHFDEDSGLLWTGHRNGSIRVWSEERREALLAAVRVYHAPISAITTDEYGHVWVASDKGKVRSYRLDYSEVDGASMGYKLAKRGELNTVGEGMPPPDYGSGEFVDGMVSSPLARDNAHYGPVRCIAAAVGRVWTCGGTSAFASFKEWTQSGILLGSQSMRSMDDSPGLVNHMRIVSPIVIVNVSERVQMVQAPSASVVTSFTGSAQTVSRLPTTTQLVPLPQAWQLLTAHDSGMVQVWGHVEQRLQPLCRIGDRVAPALRLVVCEPLGALITAHNDGRLRLRALPHPHSATGLKVTYQEGSVSKVPDQALPCALLDTSKTGLADAVGGDLGVITASNYGTIKHFPAVELRRVAEEAGLTIQSQLSDRDQWPLICFSSSGVQQLLHQLTAMQEQQQQYSIDYSALDEARATGRPEIKDGTEAPERSIFGDSEERNKWQIDWSELSRNKIIGEGAFGKVWLGRWQETDVAIKMLGSLSALGVETGSLQHDSSGGVKLDKDVQRGLEREVGLMREMRHPNIILFMGVVLEPPAVVTEFCARGSLFDLLKNARHTPQLAKQLDWGRRIVMALDAAKGMLYLHGHKPPIFHRDLKSPNLLVDKHWKVKVTDFNLSRASEAASVQSSLVANNPRWQPPEVIRSQDYGKASDVYAFGLIMWELLTWQLPFEEMSNFQIMLAVTQQGKRPWVPDQYEAAQLLGGTFSGYEAYVALMQCCWADNPQDRPTFEQIIVDLRKVATILSESRNTAKGGGPMLMHAHSRSHSRNFARMVPPAAMQQPAEQAVPAPIVQQVAGASPFDSAYRPAAAPVAAAAVGAAAVAAGDQRLLDSAYRVAPAGQQQAEQQGQGGEASNGPMSSQTSDSTAMQRDASSMSISSSAPPVPSPFDAPVPSNAAVVPSPFGGGGGTTHLVSSNAAVVPSPFGGGPSQTVSSSAAPPPSPFSGGGLAAGQYISSSAAPTPSPFGDGARAAGQYISSAAPPPPSPFGDGAPAAGQYISSAAPPPPSPFGGGAPMGGQYISSSAQPPPSPFVGGPPPASQYISSAAPPPPSPFGGGAPAAGQHYSSSTGGGTWAAPAAAAAAAAGEAQRSVGPAPHEASAPQRLSPFAARVPSSDPIAPTHPPSHMDSMPSTVMEATASAEAAAAAVPGAAGRPGPSVARIDPSQGNRGGSQLVDGSPTAAGQLPNGPAPTSDGASAAASSPDRARPGKDSGSGDGSSSIEQAESSELGQPQGSGLAAKLRQSLSGGARKLTRVQTR